MRLEYFQLIDRIIALDTAGQTIRTEAIVPTSSTIFEGHFPGYPLMPGVLLCEAMAQTSGWLIIALTRFDRIAAILCDRSGATSQDGIRWVEDICGKMNVPPLSEYGLTPDAIPDLVAAASRSSSMKGNPVTFSAEELADIVREAI